jgi:A/G-specific adenine glycosylase
VPSKPIPEIRSKRVGRLLADSYRWQKRKTNPRLTRNGRFVSNLLRWFAGHGRSFPWRDNPTPYRIAVAECILQKTSAANALPVFRDVIKEYPTLRSLAAADTGRVAELLSPLGLPRRARLLSELAASLVADNRGRFPQSEMALRKLPGVGPYGAAAIASLAFRQPAPMIDRNVMRIFGRVFSIKWSPRNGPSTELRDFMLRLMPLAREGAFNLALIDFGALVCRTRNPVCSICPLTAICDYYASSRNDDRLRVAAYPGSGGGGQLKAQPRRGTRATPTVGTSRTKSSSNR